MCRDINTIHNNGGMRIRYLISIIVFAGMPISQLHAQNNPFVGASERKVPIDTGWTNRAEFFGRGAKPDDTKNVLWYRESAKVWGEVLPLGNGRLGAMVFGEVADERIQLNENTLWDGYPLDPNNPEGCKALPEIQRLLFEDKNNEAVKLAEATMHGCYV